MPSKNATDKLDLRKALAPLYAPLAKQVVAVEVPPLQYLMVDGAGDPNTSPDYAAAVETLYSVSYTLKFATKKAGGPDYGVMPLEGLWWADDMSVFARASKADYKWTSMILQPDFVDAAQVEAAIAEIDRRKKPLPARDLLRLETLDEGLCAQVMHIGPFDAEGPTIERVHAFIAEQGRSLHGKHHEIYLSDVRRADPAKWKTIIRQPMR